jgi:hypothetical protein
MIFSAFLCVSAVNRLCIFFAFVLKWIGICTLGGNLPHIRQNGTGKNAAADTRELSAALALGSVRTAMQKCQFGGLLPHVRLPCRREIGTNGKTCESCEKLCDLSVSVVECFVWNLFHALARRFFASIPRYKPSRSFTNRSMP